jgi:hypothetical protein
MAAFRPCALASGRLRRVICHSGPSHPNRVRENDVQTVKTHPAFLLFGLVPTKLATQVDADVGSAKDKTRVRALSAEIKRLATVSKK